MLQTLGKDSVLDCWLCSSYCQVWNRVLLATQNWHERNTSPQVGLRHTMVLIFNFSLIRRSKSQLITGIFLEHFLCRWSWFFVGFFLVHRFFPFFQWIISLNWHTTVWTADISSSCWLVGVDFFYIYIYIYIYIHMWVWLGWYFVWSSWKWAMMKARITGFFIWADEYTYLKNSFHFAKGENALLAIQNPSTWFAGFWKTPFLALLCA